MATRTELARRAVRVSVSLLILIVASIVLLSCDAATTTKRGAERSGRTKSAVGTCGDGSPILVLTDSVDSNNALNFGQYFVSEILRTEGLLEFSESALTDLDSTCIATHDVVVLPSLVLTSAQATLFSDYVDGGGFLIGLRPDQQLASVFNVTPETGHFCGYDGYEQDAGAVVTAPTQTICEGGTIIPGTAAECTADTLPNGKSCAWGMTTWMALDQSHPVASGLDTHTMKIHGAAKKYSPGLGTKTIGTLYSDATSATPFPALTYYAHGGGGRAAMFTYDLSESVVTTRQGNPWLAGTNVSVIVSGLSRNRPAQMFRDNRVSPSANWNETRDGSGVSDRTTLPQADEQMHALANLILWGTTLRPLPRLWYHSEGRRTVLSLSSDGCATSATALASMRTEVHAHGGRMALYTFPFYNAAAIPQTWQTTDLDEVSIHFDNPSGPVGGIAYSTMATGVDAIQTSWRDYYNAFSPRTSRNHYLMWAATSPSGALDPAAQVRIFSTESTIKLDTSYSSYPNTFGYMTGSGLPMRYVDACSAPTVTGVYQLATQFEDDVQTTVGGTDSLLWRSPSQSIKYHQALSDAFNRYHTVVNPLFHAAHWSSIAQSGVPLLDHARAIGTPVVPPLRVYDSWAARRSVRFDSVVYSSDTLTFTVTNGVAGQTLLVPAGMTGKALSSISLDGSPVAVVIDVLQGIAYGRVVLPTNGNIIVNASYTTAYSLNGSVGATAAAGTRVNLTGYATSNSSLMIRQSVQPAANGDYSIHNLWPGTYVVSTTSDDYELSPSSQTVTLTNADVTLNFTATPGTRSLGIGYSLLTTQVPAADPVSASPITPCYELGMRFKPSVDGVITHLKFWKTLSDEDSAIGRTATLWDVTSQTKLASVTWSHGEEVGLEGWLLKALPGPIAVSGNSTYVVSVNCKHNYVYTPWGFSDPVRHRALTSDAATSAGVYNTTSGSFPATSYNNSNYFRDVVFVPRDVAVFTTHAPIATNGSGTYELGMKFTTDRPGQVKAIRYWRAPGESASGHTGKVWGSTGTQLASVSFSNETACPSAYTNGCWQQQVLSAPLKLDAGTYVVSVNTQSGKYVYTTSGLATAVHNGPIHSVAGSNGVYSTTAGSFPTTSYNSSNYFRDVIFEPGESQTLISSNSTPSGNYNDAPYELGTILYSDVPGYVTAIRFYKSTAFDGGVHVGKVWDASGRMIASVLFENETASGWQQQTLPVPLLIAPDVRYTVSVNTGHDARLPCSSNGICSAGSGVCSDGVCQPKYGYVATPSFFSSQLSSGHLHSETSAAGVYGAIGEMPTTAYNNNGYFRDVVFVPN